MSDTFPRIDADGRTVWACCVSTIGPVCQHRASTRPGDWETVGAWFDGSGGYRLEANAARTAAVLHYDGGDEHTAFHLIPAGGEFAEVEQPADWSEHVLTDRIASTIDYGTALLLRLDGVTYTAHDRTEYGPVHPGGGLFAADLEPGDRITDPDGDPVAIVAVDRHGDDIVCTIAYADGSIGALESDAAEVWGIAD